MQDDHAIVDQACQSLCASLGFCRGIESPMPRAVAFATLRSEMPYRDYDRRVYSKKRAMITFVRRARERQAAAAAAAAVKIEPKAEPRAVGAAAAADDDIEFDETALEPSIEPIGWREPSADVKPNVVDVKPTTLGKRSYASVKSEKDGVAVDKKPRRVQLVSAAEMHEKHGAVKIVSKSTSAPIVVAAVTTTTTTTTTAAAAVTTTTTTTVSDANTNRTRETTQHALNDAMADYRDRLARSFAMNGRRNVGVAAKIARSILTLLLEPADLCVELRVQKPNAALEARERARLVRTLAAPDDTIDAPSNDEVRDMNVHVNSCTVNLFAGCPELAFDVTRTFDVVALKALFFFVTFSPVLFATRESASCTATHLADFRHNSLLERSIDRCALLSGVFGALLQRSARGMQLTLRQTLAMAFDDALSELAAMQQPFNNNPQNIGILLRAKRNVLAVPALAMTATPVLATDAASGKTE